MLEGQGNAVNVNEKAKEIYEKLKECKEKSTGLSPAVGILGGISYFGFLYAISFFIVSFIIGVTAPFMMPAMLTCLGIGIVSGLVALCFYMANKQEAKNIKTEIQGNISVLRDDFKQEVSQEIKNLINTDMSRTKGAAAYYKGLQNIYEEISNSPLPLTQNIPINQDKLHAPIKWQAGGFNQDNIGSKIQPQMGQENNPKQKGRVFKGKNYQLQLH
jgi:hypothetical protein